MRTIIIYTGIDNPGGKTMAKTATFAVLHFTVAFSVGYALTGDIVIGGAVALIEPAVNTVAFYFHEKAWTLFSGNGRENPGPAVPEIA
jgi:uncharacterized membrane protein